MRGTHRLKEKHLHSGFLVGIAGGSGSGKSYITEALLRELGGEDMITIQQDSYYCDLSHLTPDERSHVNFDHPDAVDVDLLIRQITNLLMGEAIDMPIYDFVHHVRSENTRRVEPAKLIILEGILIFAISELRELMDIKVFVDTDSDVRFIRRLRRDIQERGRSLESVIHQWETTVRPMHREFVEPWKQYADVVVSGEKLNKASFSLLKREIETLLMERGKS